MRKTKPADSFFNFFTPPPPMPEDDDEDVDEEAMAENEMKLEVDYQIGEDFKEKVRICPISFRIRVLIEGRCRSSPARWTTSPERRSSTSRWTKTTISRTSTATTTTTGLMYVHRRTDFCAFSDRLPGVGV